jgi:hypothetical protein
MAFFDTPGYAQNVTVTGNIAYVADASGGVRIIDVSNPSAPRELNHYGGYAYDVFVSGFFAYVTEKGDGFSIFHYRAPGIIDVHPTSVSLDEPSSTGSFTFKLAKSPAADVVVELINTRPTECRLSDSTVVLNDANWDTGVTVTLTAEDDSVLDGKQYAAIITGDAKSEDPVYNGYNPDNIIVAIADDEKEVGIHNVYPTYATEGQALPVTIAGKNFIQDTTRVFISDYPGGGNETLLSANVVSDTKITLTIPGQPVGDYNLKVANGDVTGIYENAVSFAPAATIDKQAGRKAIIVAGGGNSRDNDLIYASRTQADLACLALYAQGYTNDTVFYLNPESSDANGDGLNDVDRETTVDNLYYAVNYWAKGLDDPDDPFDLPPDQAATDLLLYMTGPGIPAVFHVNYSIYSWETLEAGTLDSWLDGLNLSGVLVTVYDACQSGSFLPVLAGPNRVVISGTKADERAWFLDNGDISFSGYFWNAVIDTGNITQAFLTAKNAITQLQTPLMDDDGDGVTNWRGQMRADSVNEVVLGRGRSVPVSRPTIKDVIIDPTNLSGGTVSATITANTDTGTDPTEISSVWARILPPFENYLPANVAAIAVPTRRLHDPEQDGSFVNTFEDFHQHGTYDIFVHMKNKAGNEAVPIATNLNQEDGQTIEMGDLNLDQVINLKDLLIVMNLLRGEDVSESHPHNFIDAGIDVNGNGLIGTEEMLYIMEIIAQLR